MVVKNLQSKESYISMDLNPPKQRKIDTPKEEGSTNQWKENLYESPSKRLGLQSLTSLLPILKGWPWSSRRKSIYICCFPVGKRTMKPKKEQELPYQTKKSDFWESTEKTTHKEVLPQSTIFPKNMYPSPPPTTHLTKRTKEGSSFKISFHKFQGVTLVPLANHSKR